MAAAELDALLREGGLGLWHDSEFKTHDS